MTLKEVMQALIDGKKLRRNEWKPNSFVMLKGDNLVDNHGKTLPIFLEDPTDFEILQEPKYVYKFAFKCRDAEYWTELATYLPDKEACKKLYLLGEKNEIKRLDYTRLEL